MSINPDINSFNTLKQASLWFIIATLIGFIGLISSLAGIVAIVSLILILLFALPQLRNAFQGFLQTGKNVGSGLTGANILPWAYLLEVIGGLIAISGIFVISRILAGLGVIIIILAVLLELVAGILIGLAVYNLGRFYKSDMMWISGILIIIPGLSFIGWILLYVSIDEVVNKIRGGIMPVQPPYQQPYQPYSPQPTPQQFISVYQTGSGQLTEDGKAVFSLYSSAQIQILGASIDNTTIAVGPDKISPQILTSGNNVVTIQFPSLTGLGFIKQNIYTITLSLANGQSIKVYVTFT